MVGGFEPEHPIDGSSGANKWDLGRIRYFIEELEKSTKLNPIEVDWVYSG